MNRRTTTITTSLLAGACLMTTSSSLGADRFWNTSAGLFGDPKNWDDGAMGPPTPLDTAVFEVPGLYSVIFEQSRVTDRVLVRRGAVTFRFDDASQYELLNGSPTTPGIIVGVGDGDVASLELDGGAALATFAELGQLPSAVGSLDVAGAGCGLDVELLLRVGNEGVGMMTASDGATVTCLDAEIGRAAGAYGDVTMTGPDTVFDVAGDLTVGTFGAASMHVAGAAVVRSERGAIGQNLGAFGDVTISGADVPMASTVSPTTRSGTPSSRAISSAPDTTKLALTATPTAPTTNVPIAINVRRPVGRSAPTPPSRATSTWRRRASTIIHVR